MTIFSSVQPKLYQEAKLLLPMLEKKVNGLPYIYMNNAATALKPYSVLAKMQDYYQNYGVSIYRGTDDFAYQADTAFEQTRQHVSKFINAKNSNEIVFLRGATAALNLVALSYGNNIVNAGDEVIVTPMEHHANYVPWQQLCLRKGAKLILAPLDKNGIIDLAALKELLSEHVKLVAFAGISNLMGATQDIAKICKICHQFSPAKVVVDAAQLIVHKPIDVQAWDCDFLAFSGHKLYGPTGIGCLYGKKALLEAMPPLETGGEMIDIVDVYETSFKEAPWRFEAGTMPVAEVIGLDAALDYVEKYQLNIDQKDYLAELTAFANEGLSELEHVEIYNRNNFASGIIAFNIKGVHPHDAASVFAKHGIALRAGNHCAQPTLRWLGINNCLRASLAFFNTVEDINTLILAAKEAKDFLSVLF